MRAYKAWHCNEFQNYCCLCYSCHCAKMGVTSNHWSRALIESIVTTLLQENQEINDSLKEYGVLKARILKWFAIPFSSGPHFVRTLHHDPSVLGGPAWHGSPFHRVSQAPLHDKAVSYEGDSLGKTDAGKDWRQKEKGVAEDEMLR